MTPHTPHSGYFCPSPPVPQVVINFDPPETIESFTHRREKACTGGGRTAHLVTLVPYGQSGVDALWTQSTFNQDNEIEKERERENERDRDRDIRGSPDGGVMCSLSDVILYCTEVYSRSADCHTVAPSAFLDVTKYHDSSRVTVPIVEMMTKSAAKSAACLQRVIALHTAGELKDPFLAGVVRCRIGQYCYVL